MAPHGPRASAPKPRPPPPPAVAEEHPPVKGPHPGYMAVARQYTLEQKLRRMQKENGCDPSNEDKYRLMGIQLIENVRESLQLPVKTFDTACTYYHKFRLSFRDAEYNYQDAALASLFVACKVEDTIKKSKEILCAAYNTKTPEKPTTSDDKIFEGPSRVIIGLERLILETIGFDFRVRYPQKLLSKLIRQVIPDDRGKEFMSIAFPMSLDMYKTFSPIKHSSFTMVISIVELCARILDKDIDVVKSLDTRRYHTNRCCVVESMLDMLDLYTHFQKSTKVGVKFELDKLIDIKIRLNKEVDDDEQLFRFADLCDKCASEDREVHPFTPGSAPATSPATVGSWPGSNSVKRNQNGHEDTLRFVFDVDEEKRERDTVAEYFREEYEEYETELEEEVHEQNHHTRHAPPLGPSNKQGGSRRDRHDASWAPYPRGRHHHDRIKGRKGYNN